MTTPTKQSLAAMRNIRQPKPLMLSENQQKDWKNWKTAFEWSSIATGLNDESPAVQVATCMSMIGEDVGAILNSLILTTTDKEKVETLIMKLDEYFLPKANEVFEAYIFNKIKQEEGESIDQFLTRVRIQAKNCNFGQLENKMVREKITIGISQRCTANTQLCTFSIA